MKLARSAIYLMAIGLFFVVGQKLLQHASNVGEKSWRLLK